MRLSTWNLRFDSQPDNITVQQSLNRLPSPLVEPTFLDTFKEQPWSTRRVRVAELLLSEGADISCFQEALIRQVRDLAELFGDDWSWVGVGRDDGVAAGEFSPVFYNQKTFKLLSNDSFWLSDTPFEPSKFPGAGSFRICTATRFQVLSTGKRFTLLNTHLDDQSDQERRLGASLLLTRARFEAVNTKEPVLITGDFNSPSSGSDSGAYGIITGAITPVAINATFAKKYAVPDDQLPNFNMIDLRGATPRRSVSTNFATFTGFTAPNDTKEWVRIDFLFGGSNMGWESEQYKVLAALSDDGVLSSDHRPVFLDISI
ncbi:hypothetical protein AMATHDRAFT_157676 [Amanita thiersii Skay4041]|uniref:Endonuclease/exonuclease/phosphatase domain-containing protein n=1 Tax=Amanita thiersii Skay4041 TaxID=703135 RepID=A0A2A9NDP0_9AGAR|nr:hypothetical protein AMATHDRAFT_157676 [Amanita thiersii Skay4041]